MKRTVFLYVVSLLLVACGGGGDDPGEGPVISKDYINVPPNVQLLGDGQETEVNVTATCSWTISNPVTWLTISPLSGNKNAIVKISAGKNSTEQERSATLTVSGGNAPSRTIVVTQAKGSENPALSVNLTTLDFEAKSETKSFVISSNVGWTISKPEWCSLSHSSGKGNEEITVTVSDNTEKERTGQIVINGDGVNSVTIVITQKSKDKTNSEEPGEDDNQPPQ